MQAIRVLIVVTLALGLAGVLVVVRQVDDWSRDLSTNVAETAEGARDSLLRPVDVSLPLDAAVRAVEHAAATLRGWALTERVTEGDTIRLHFTRTTRLFRFVDDITVWIEDRGDRRHIRARSASRRGNGDLGQNPRNLRELLSAL